MAEQFIKSHGLTLMGEDAWHAGIEHWTRNWEVRHEYIKRFGFAVLSTRALAALTQYGPFLEVGAGTGYWAYEMRKAGIDIIATDPYPGRRGRYWDTEWKVFTDIVAMTGPRAALKWPERTLLTVWPDYSHRWPAVTLQVYKGPCVIYVGEGEGGCTGNDDFHRLLERDFKKEKTVSIPQFLGIHDRMMVYKRKGDTNGRRS